MNTAHISIKELLPISWDFHMVYPQIVILAFICGILIYNLIQSEDDPQGSAVLALGALITAGGFSMFFFRNDTVYPAFGNMLIIDRFSLFFNALFCLAGILAVLSSMRYIEREDMNRSEYYVVLLGAVLGMMVMASAANLLTVFIGIEILSISLYILAGFNRDRAESGESAIKYLLLGSFATGFLLYGISMIYGGTGSLDINTIALFLKHGGKPGAMLIAGMIMLLTGFSFKASLAPFHMWAPDVYQGAPTPVTGFMSTAAKGAAFAVFLRILVVALPDMNHYWHAMLYAICIATMFIGNLTAIVQTNIKRMLAYSSVAQAGYLVIAMLASGQGVSVANNSIVFYLLTYTLMNMGAFGIIAALGSKERPCETLSSFAGLGFRRPALAAAMSIFLLSLAGMPPTAGFVGKFYIFTAALKAGLLPLVIIGVLNAVISVYYYLRVIVVMYMHAPEEDLASEPISASAAIAAIFCVAGIFILGIIPSVAINLASSAIFAQTWTH